MDVYNTEEEQVQAIKKWWKDNAVSLIAGIAIGVVVIAGYQFWIKNKQNDTQQASILYSDVLSSANDKSKNVEILKDEYSSTPYAALAVLLLAKDNVTSNDVEKAVLQLKWVIENNNSDGIQHIAQQRLARLYLAQNNTSSAEELIKGLKSQGFSAVYSEIRGDINLAKNLPVQAKENYLVALSALNQGDQRFAIIKMKLDDLTQAASMNTSSGVK